MRRLGGYSIMTLFGKNPFQSKKSLWLYLTGKLDGAYESEAMEWGKRMEPVILQKYQEQHRSTKIVSSAEYSKPEFHPVLEANEICYFHDVPRELFLFRHTEHDFITAAVDGLIMDKSGKILDAILECKNCSIFTKRRFGNEEEPELPEYIRIQVNHYMGISGAERAVAAVLFGGNSYAEFDVDFDEEKYEEGIELAVKFWQDHVVTGKPPIDDKVDKTVMDWMADTYGNSNKVFHKADEYENIVAGGLSLAYQEMKIAEYKYELLEQRLIGAVGEDAGVVADVGRLTVVRTKRTRTSWKDVCKEVADEIPEELIEKYTKDNKPGIYVRTPQSWSETIKAQIESGKF